MSTTDIWVGPELRMFESTGLDGEGCDQHALNLDSTYKYSVAEC